MSNAPRQVPSIDDIGRQAVRFIQNMEHSDPGESETRAGLIETIAGIQRKVHADTGQAMRGVHAKCHGVVSGTLQVRAGLPAAFAQGLFAVPATYPVIMRFSTIPGDVLDDEVSVPRGLALKVIGVPGARVQGSEAHHTQDFVLANGTTFGTGRPKAFLSTLKLVAATTDKAPGLKKALSVVMRGAERLVESLGGQSATLMTLGGYPEIHILGDEFYSQAPILFGDHIAKIALKPFSANLRRLHQAPVDLKHKPDGLREAVREHFLTQDGEWDLQVQLCTDLDAMPIEDAAQDWPQNLSPYFSVARISVPLQDSWQPARVDWVEHRLAFTPWHALAAHRPLGAIMRVRQAVYEAAARFRAEHLGIVMSEPESADDIPR